ncbi:S1C family serine protease [Nocardiopsis oceani]
MHPNDPSDGPETGAGAEHGDTEHGHTGSGAAERPADHPVDPEAPVGPEASSAPRFSLPEGATPSWATGPNDTDRASYVFPEPEGQQGPNAGAPSGPQPGAHTGAHPGAQPGPYQTGAHQTGTHQTGAYQTGAFQSGPFQGAQHGTFGGPGGPYNTGPHNPGPHGAGPHQGFEQPGFGQHPHGQFGQGPFPGQPQPKKRGTGRIIAIAAVTALVTSLIVGPAVALGTAYLMPGGASSPISSLTGEQGSSATEGAVGDVADEVMPSVVSIQTGAGGGSGVIISSDGQILTNAHVVEAGEGGPIQVQFSDGTAAEAEVLGADPVSDIAVIQAEGRDDLTPATLGDSDQVGVGGDVVAIGSPLGLSGTVTTGVVSSLNRPVNTGATESGGGQTSTVINAIQTDAAINPGNSGGPLVNMAGEVIGVNTAIAGLSQEGGSVGLGFAIPINQVQPIAEQLVENGSASYPAIQATIAPSRGGGAEIMELTEGGSAEEAGLEAGDVVVSVEGEEVTSPDQLIAQIRSRQPGDDITLGVLSGGSGNEQEVELTLGEQSAEAASEEDAEED